MALPEPTPPVKGEAARELKARLEKHRLAPEQKELYRGVKAAFQARRRRE